MRKISMFVLAAVVALVAACGGGGADSADAGGDAVEGTGAVVAPAVVDGTGDGTGASVESLETPVDGSAPVEPAPVVPTEGTGAPEVDASAAE